MARTRTPSGGTARKSRSRGTQPRRQRAAAVAVSEEQRRQLIADVAFFHAEQHRVVAAGDCREEDRRRAEAEIDAVLKRPRRRS
jgi:hypothetical protein